MTRNLPSQTESAWAPPAGQDRSALLHTMPRDIPSAPTATPEYTLHAAQPENVKHFPYLSNSVPSASSSASSPSGCPPRELVRDLDFELTLDPQIFDQQTLQALDCPSIDPSALEAPFIALSGDSQASPFGFSDLLELGLSQPTDYGHLTSHWAEPEVYKVPPSTAFSDPDEYLEDASLATALGSARVDEDLFSMTVDSWGPEYAEDILADLDSNLTAATMSTSPITLTSTHLHHADTWPLAKDIASRNLWQPVDDDEHSFGLLNVPATSANATPSLFNNFDVGSFTQHNISTGKHAASSSDGNDGSTDIIPIAGPSKLQTSPLALNFHVGSAPAALPAFVYVHESVDNSMERRLTLPADDTTMVKSRVNIKGRKGSLNPVQRRNAAEMRKIGACDTCRKRRAKCDAGNPCGACINYWRGDLHLHPCRPHMPTAWSQLPEVLLPILLRWCPSEKSLAMHQTGTGGMSRQLWQLPFSFGFGPPMWLKTRLVKTENPSDLLHTNTSYDWPAKVPIRGPKTMHHHIMIPVVLDEPRGVPAHLESHLERLVRDHFHDYPFYASPLAVLMPIHRLYVGMGHDQFLGKCLKLLILVHCCGDISVDESDPTVQLILRRLFACGLDGGTRAIPCFVRGQIGTAISRLVQALMREVLSELERRSFTKACSDFAIVISAYIVLAMVIETAQYHGAKMGFHSTEVARFDAKLPGILDTCRDIEQRGVAQLFLLYRRCFSQCHAGAFFVHNDAHSASWSTAAVSSAKGTTRSRANSARSNGSAGTAAAATSRKAKNPREVFVAEIRAIVSDPQTREYIRQRSSLEISDTMPLQCFFDRIVARLFPSMNELNSAAH